jgi:hypothetical protein
MATVQRVKDYKRPTANVTAQAALYKWTLTDTDSTGTSISLPSSPDKTVQIFGAFNSGTVTIQGSNEFEPVNWNTLHDHSGADLVFTAAGIELIAENPMHIRAIVTGTVGTASLTVLLLARG